MAAPRAFSLIDGEHGALYLFVMVFARDGAAVAGARTVLQGQGVPDSHLWRSTVVSDEHGGWVVRTWTRTPQDEPRPCGPPDYVHRVHPDEAGEDGLGVRQVHPRYLDGAAAPQPAPNTELAAIGLSSSHGSGRRSFSTRVDQ